MDKKLFDILACPLCKGRLDFNRTNNELVCRFDKLAFPVRDGVPVMLEEEARPLCSDELEG